MRASTSLGYLAIAVAAAVACFSVNEAEAKEADRIHELPGWVDPDTGKSKELPMPVYAGYVNAGTKRDSIFGKEHDVFMHYVFIQVGRDRDDTHRRGRWNSQLIPSRPRSYPHLTPDTQNPTPFV